MRMPIVLVSLTLGLTAGAVAYAQSPQQTKLIKSRSSQSMECSKQADEKGLHGKARRHFRSKCLKQAKGQAA
jgi:hypothetical protein